MQKERKVQEQAMSGWIGVDFDGTLAHYDHWVGPDQCGAPIAPMVDLVKRYLAEGIEVRIFTARIWPITFPQFGDEDLDLPASLNPDNERVVQARAAVEAIRAWCKQHIGRVLPITCVKDYGMITLYDDRAIQVRKNTGELVE